VTEKLLFFDQETGGKIFQNGTSLLVIYPEKVHTICPIYKKNSYCCGDECIESCKYYKFYVNSTEWFKLWYKEKSYRKTLDYFFEGVE